MAQSLNMFLTPLQKQQQPRLFLLFLLTVSPVNSAWGRCCSGKSEKRQKHTQTQPAQSRLTLWGIWPPRAYLCDCRDECAINNTHSSLLVWGWCDISPLLVSHKKSIRSSILVRKAQQQHAARHAMWYVVFIK